MNYTLNSRLLQFSTFCGVSAQNEPMIPTFTKLGKIEIRTNGLTFHPDGTLWGWSSGKGLFQIQNNKENKPNLNK